MKKLLLAFCASLLGISAPSTLGAAELVFVNVGPATAHGGVIYDDATGAYYRRPNYYPPFHGGAGGITAFESKAAFEGNSNGTAIALAGDDSGTYYAARNGFVYGHLGSEAPTVGKWDAATGILIASASPTGFGASNGDDSFDWGGYSAMNVMQDATGMYLFSGSASGGRFMLGRLSDDLTVSNVSSFGQLMGSMGAGPGFGFMAGGTLFLGEDWYTPAIAYSMKAADGSLKDISNIGFVGLSADPYITHLEYVEGDDALYLWDYSNGSGGALFRATGVAAVLGLSSAVPEPSSWAMLIVGFGAVGWAMRRRRQEPAPVLTSAA